jgi:hypothetical protein
VTQGMTLEVMAREGTEKVLTSMVNNFRIHDRRMISCMQRGVELPPARGN